MRRPPFTVRPLALSVTLAIATPVAVAADIAASAVASPQEVNNVVLTASDNVISVATEVTGIIKEQNDTNSTQLIKQGAGTLSLTNNNTYKGGTDVQAGTLSVARAASLGDGTVNLADGSTLETQSSTTLTQDITLDGNATIKMGGQNAAQNITQITSAITEKDQKNGNSSLTKSGAGTLS
ncbi:autotransporter-associated beta strand repeat-containing protein, partial [uncultured Agitococcus sp.]|uniref:autotransporter-associated beta strand repeat-containing protein n=1 Tax=uncultured Agitococcus sp. TaxID=1506599 RepID=UPI002613B3A7